MDHRPSTRYTYSYHPYHTTNAAMAEAPPDIEHPPRRPIIPFPGGEPRFRTMRGRAAVACRQYNELSEDTDTHVRQAALKAILDNPDVDAPTEFHDSVSISSALERYNLPNGMIAPHHAIEAPSTPTSAIDNPIISTELTTTPPARQHRNSHPGFGTVPLIKGPLWIDYGTNVHIDGTSFINRGCKILDTPLSELRIGKECAIGPDVHFYCVTHPLDPDERHNPDSKTSSLAGDIILGDRVWIGGGVRILPGVTIGDGCVIGAGSVVTRSMPPYVLAHGVPARIKRRIPCTARGAKDSAKHPNANSNAKNSPSSPLLLSEPSGPTKCPTDEIASLEAGQLRLRQVEMRMVRLELVLGGVVFAVLVLAAVVVYQCVLGKGAMRARENWTY